MRVLCGHRQEQGRPEEASEACCSCLRKGRRRYPRAPGAAAGQHSANGTAGFVHLHQLQLNMDTIHGDEKERALDCGDFASSQMMQ
jgi:hypothetical protein